MFEKIFISKKKRELSAKRKKFYQQFLTPNDIYFDVGANMGNRIEPIINEDIKIVAIEPQPKCIKRLERKFKDKIIIIPKGVGEVKEKKTMYIAKAHTISTFSKDFIKATKESGRFSKYNWNKEISVDIDTLDNIISQHGKPSFIKIDVEGFEYQVLKGLTVPIKFISFEYTIPERKESILNCIDRIVEISNENKVFFNYSIGESMEWALEKWLTPIEMKKEIEKKSFIDSNFGDIYSKIE